MVPTVWLLIDGSGSMSDSLGASSASGRLPPSRWEALRETLLDRTTGVIAQLARDVRFGLVLYDGPLGGSPGALHTLPDGGPAISLPPTNECPRLIAVEPQLDSFAALDAAFPELPPGGSTPTHKALEYLTEQLPNAAQSGAAPTYVVFATDGTPNDFCAVRSNTAAFSDPEVTAKLQRNIVSQTQRIAKQGTPTYVISLAAGDQALSEHLAQVAGAGGTNEVFTPETSAQLVEAFHQILGPEVRCSIRLPSPRGKQIDACQAQVRLDGELLACDSTDGWRLRDSTTLELTGRACEAFKQKGAHLEALFPCYRNLR